MQRRRRKTGTEKIRRGLPGLLEAVRVNPPGGMLSRIHGLGPTTLMPMPTLRKTPLRPQAPQSLKLMMLGGVPQPPLPLRA